MNACMRWGPMIGLLGASACSGSNAPNTTMEIRAAALELEGIDEAVYTMHVENAAGDVVWHKTVGSNQYGDGRGALSYVGTCDATSNPNRVTLTLDSLVDSAGHTLTDEDWKQPPPVTQEVVCRENEDVLVEFNLSVMRDAKQGFYDMVVNFEDIFCSAKLDCQDALLHDPATGERGLAAVVALACTAGEGQQTTMYWGDAAIICGDDPEVRYPIAPGAAPGNQGPIYAVPGDAESNGVYQWATYFTDEHFDADDIDKCAWTMGIGLDLDKLGPDCRFEAIATATDGRFIEPAMHTPKDTVYPVIRYKVRLTDGQGALVCGNNPLDGEGSGVQTEYTSYAGQAFEVGAGCDGEVFTNTLACTGAPSGEPTVEFAPAADGKVTVSYGGQTIGPFALPEGTTFSIDGNECCAEPCCEEAN